MGFWIWLALWLVGWIGAVLFEWMNSSTGLPYFLVMAAVFFSLFFFSFMMKRGYAFVWFVLIGIITVTFLLPLNHVFNPFVILMLGFSLVMITQYKSGKALYGLVSTILIAIFILHIEFVTPMLVWFFSLLLLAILLAVYYFKKYTGDIDDLASRYQALLHTYRNLKRESITRDQHAREQERLIIGREIHDRVGHTLTNLLMQIEILRLQEEREDLEKIKSLAQESLSETRKAVKALKEEHVTGIAAIIQLIRKLEAEQYISIHFSMRQNALSVVLSPKQATVVYRAIQEALTNAMRHSNGEEVTIVLEAPGMTHFRFEVINPLETNTAFKEGFGLQSMRERLAQMNGTLEVRSYQEQFIVRGILPMEEGKE